MLRRAQSIASILDRDDEQIPETPPEEAPVRKLERRSLDAWRDEEDPPERRSAERRSLDELRAEMQRTLNPQTETANFGGVLPKFGWNWAIKPSRVLLLVVALGAGGLAAYLAVHRDAPVVEAVPAPVPQEAPAAEVAPVIRVLVAKQAIGVGQRLSAENVEWQDWPQQALRSDYVTNDAAPEAVTEMAGDVARFAFFAGEPIRAEKLVKTDEGYLSMVLGPGMRGVSVLVNAESASGGYIVPNDRVDVVLTRASDTGQSSQTIVHNARVLAIGNRLGADGGADSEANPDDPNAEMFTTPSIATLEVNATQAEMIVSATVAGRLSLVVRSITDTATPDAQSHQSANDAIRMTSPFWTR